MKKMSKKQKVLLYMKTYGSITPKDAIDLFKAYRLSAIIFDLKKEGHKIDTERKGKSGYAEYSISLPF